MNIFVISDNQQECAEVLDDKRLNKMILETLQLLCTTFNLRGNVTSYKSTHTNHPCRKWLDESNGNIFWLAVYFERLSHEYSFRFEKGHKCSDVYKYQILPLILNKMTSEGRTAFKNCSMFKDMEDTFTAYRLTLYEKWLKDKRKPKWTKRKPPAWVPKEVIETVQSPLRGTQPATLNFNHGFLYGQSHVINNDSTTRRFIDYTTQRQELYEATITQGNNRGSNGNSNSGTS